MSGVEVRVLGPVELRIDGLLAPIERVQVRRMLAVLAINAGSSVPVDRVIDELWPGDLPSSPRSAVRVIASRLRAGLGKHAACLRSSSHDYVLAIDADAVDASVFEALVSGDSSVTAPADELARLDIAFELWRGEPFSGALGPPALDRASAYLAELRLSGTIRRAELLIGAGSPHRAVALLAPLIIDDEVDERLWAVHATALAGVGRRTEALGVIARAQRVMRGVHGLAPSGPLATAEGLIAEASAASEPADVAPPGPTLFGRDREIGAALSWLRSDVEERPVVVITGAPGSGKTALAVAVCNRLGMRTVHAQCHSDFAEVDSVAALLGIDGGALVSGDRRSRAIRVVDEIVATVSSRAASAPLALIIDDLQWAGDVELRLVPRLVRAASSANIYVLLTMRDPDGGEGEPAVAMLAGIEQSNRVSRLELGGLEREPSRRAYASWSGRRVSPAETTTLMELTDGNPYLIRSLGAANLDLTLVRLSSTRPLFHDVTTARLGTLPNDDESVLRTAAVLGRTIDVEVLAAVTERSSADIAAALDRAIAKRLLRDDGRSIQFDHDLTRLGLAADVGPAAASLMHAAATDAARALGRDLVVVARHVLGAGSLRADRRAGADLLTGADRAESRGWFDEAARFLEAAAHLETDPARRLDVERQRAWAMECAGDRVQATALYEEIFATARQRDLPAILGRAALGGATFGGVVGGDPGRLARLTDALANAPADERLHLELAAALVAELDAADRPIPAALLELVASLASDDEASAVRRAVDLRVIRRLPVSPRLLADVEDHVHSARHTGSIPLILEAEEMVARARLTCGDLDGTQRARDDLARTVRAHRWPRYVWSVALLDAVVSDLRSGPTDAEDLARRALHIGREHGIGDAINGYSMFRLSVAVRDATLSDLEPWIRAAIDGPAPVPAWHAVLAASLSERGDETGAMESLERFWAGTGDGVPAFTHIGLALAARAAVLLRDQASLRACIDRLLPWSGNLLVVGVGAACFGPADLVLADAMDAADDRRAREFRQAGTRLLARA